MAAPSLTPRDDPSLTSRDDPSDGLGTSVAPSSGARSPRYLRQLLALLVSVSFFEGYDGSILSLLLADVQASFRASEALLGVVRIPIELGLVVAFAVTNLADRVGRRRLLLWSVTGYTLFTALTAVSWDIWSFAFAQFGSRVFLGAEYAVALTMVAEEFPTERRGRALGTLTTLEALGTILVALLLGARLNETALGWRAFFLVGLGPLVLLGLLRRRLRETRRYELLVQRRAAGLEAPRQSLLEVWRPGLRRDLVLIGTIHLLRSLPLYATTAWWAYFAERERGYSSLRVALTILVAYGVGCLGYYVCGRLMDRIGRRPTAVMFLLGTVVFALVEFRTTNAAVGFVALALAVAFGLGARPVLSAWVAELFPTQVRSQAASYVRNLFEVTGAVLGPALIGILGDHEHGAIGNIGDAAGLTVLLMLPAAWLVWRHLPETKGVDLDDIDARGLAGAGDLPARGAVARVGAGVALALVALGAMVVVTRHDAPRPEGTVERWLVAVSETGRDGLRADARRRVERAGATGAADAALLRRADRPADRLRFASIEVGRAVAGRVPFAVTRNGPGGSTDRVRGLATVGSRCSAIGTYGVCEVRADESARVPSDGGAPASGAPWWLWALTLAVALLLGPLLGRALMGGTG